MHIDDFEKIRRLADDRTRLIYAKEEFLRMFVEGLEWAGEHVPMTISCMYRANERSGEKIAKIYVNGEIGGHIVAMLDAKIAEKNSELAKLGIFTDEREEDHEST